MDKKLMNSNLEDRESRLGRLEFLLLQPAVLFYTFLVLCFFLTVCGMTETPSKYTFAPSWLIYAVPVTLIIEASLYALRGQLWSAARMIAMLFIVAPMLSALIVVICLKVLFKYWMQF